MLRILLIDTIVVVVVVVVTCTKPIKMISLKQDREEDHQRDDLPKYEKTRVYLS